MFSFFFCKQKTAYEMRISDWSSDVCSSDLVLFGVLDAHAGEALGDGAGGFVDGDDALARRDHGQGGFGKLFDTHVGKARGAAERPAIIARGPCAWPASRATGSALLLPAGEGRLPCFAALPETALLLRSGRRACPRESEGTLRCARAPSSALRAPSPVNGRRACNSRRAT